MLSEHEYIFLSCPSCKERVKLAKNKGNYWKTDYNPTWLPDFLLSHQDCKEIVITLED